MMRTRLTPCLAACLSTLVGCGPEAKPFPEDMLPTNGTGDMDSAGSTTKLTDGEVTLMPPPLPPTGTTSGATSGTTSGPEWCRGDGECPTLIDLLFVIDNSSSMAEEQLNLAKNFDGLIASLKDLRDPLGRHVAPDINIMVTTTDFGHPQCAPFQTHDPEKGRPITTHCVDRIDRFSLPSQPPIERKDVCESVCTTLPQQGTHMTKDPFLHFTADGNNVVEGGTEEMALSCLGPQGVDGCGYESPLEVILQALHPMACWNNPHQDRCKLDVEMSTWTQGFLRRGSIIGIVLVTDEEDCSVSNDSIFKDPQFMEVNPRTGTPEPSSAVCWNAGVQCDGPDAAGVFSNCRSKSDRNLHPVSRYQSFLKGFLTSTDDPHEVFMLGIVGVPLVTKYAEYAPFQPIEGGVLALQYREWRPEIFPAGDLLPADAQAGRTVADLHFGFGIGPACTGLDGKGGFTGQAVPTVRIKEVCQALDTPDDPMTDFPDGKIRCCLVSVCDTDFSPAIQCLSGSLRTVTWDLGSG